MVTILSVTLPVPQHERQIVKIPRPLPSFPCFSTFGTCGLGGKIAIPFTNGIEIPFTDVTVPLSSKPLSLYVPL